MLHLFHWERGTLAVPARPDGLKYRHGTWACIMCHILLDFAMASDLDHGDDCPGWIEPAPRNAGLPPEVSGGAVITQNWEEGLTCPVCDGGVQLGEEIIYGKHVACFRASRRQEAAGDPVQAAEAALETGGRVAIPKSQLRALALLACESAGVDPVRRPDRGKKGVRWYARCSGWTAARVEAGLSMSEVAGLWLDVLDSGRTPPVSHDHLRMLLDAVRAKVV